MTTTEFTETNLTGTQIAQLTAILTGGGYTRSASKDAAIRRFLSVATDKGFKNTHRVLDAADFAAAEKLVKDQALFGETSATVANSERMLDDVVQKVARTRRAMSDAAASKAPAEMRSPPPARKPKAEKPVVVATNEPKTRAARADYVDGSFRNPKTAEATTFDLVLAIGPAKVGAFRAEWIKRDAEFGKLAPTQQKGIMRKAINRLVEAGKLTRDGSIFSVAKSDEKVAA